MAEGIDTLVLGCTHYPLPRPAISRLLGDEVTVVDSAELRHGGHAAARPGRSPRHGGESGSLAVALTDPPDAFLEVAKAALQLDLGTVQLRQVLHPAC